MAHFAILDENNVVTAVNVIADTDCLDGSNNESEAVGIAFCESLFGVGTYKQTSYNSTIRKNYAGVGDIYDSSRDAFIAPKPHASWILVEDTCQWTAPITRPSNNDYIYHWVETDYQNDNTTGWKEKLI